MKFGLCGNGTIYYVTGIALLPLKLSLLLLLCAADVASQAGGGGAPAMGGADREEGVGFLGAHRGHCGAALRRKGPG